jgi:hypothetical protein
VARIADGLCQLQLLVKSNREGKDARHYAHHNRQRDSHFHERPTFGIGSEEAAKTTNK